MRKHILFAFATVLLYACAIEVSDGDTYGESRTSFQYSIIVKDHIGRDLLANETMGHYPDDWINIISPAQENVKEQTCSVGKYDNEYRIVVKVDYDEKMRDSHVETILELCVLWPGHTIPQKTYVDGERTVVPEGIYTYDTIKCNTGLEKGNIICNDITVNGRRAWERTGKDEEPYIELEKDECLDVTITGLPDPPPPD